MLRKSLVALIALVAGDVAAQPAPSSTAGWTFNVAPYLWLPSVDTQLRYNLPGGDGASRAHVSVDSATILEDLNFGAMIGAEAGYGRFSVLTDLIYLDLSSSESAVKSVDFVQVGRDRVTSSVNAGTQSSLTGSIWGLAGGYTLLEGDWGNVDATFGFRLFTMDARTDVRLGADITAPNSSQSFARSQRLSDSITLFDGIVGVRGRFVLGSGFHLPYAFDIGTGSSRLTWQGLAGIAYQTGWAGVTLGYRYLYYDQSGDKLLEDFSLGGPFLAVNFTF